MPNTHTDQQQHSEWFVLGAGALGCLWAAMLAKCGSKVTVIVRHATQNRRHSAQLRYSRLHTRPQSGPGHPDHSALTHPQAHTASLSFSPPTSYAVDRTTLLALASTGTTITNLLVTTKSYDALTAIEAVLPLLEPGAKVLTLCNGYGLHQPIAELLSSQQRDFALYAGVCSDGALLRGPLDVVHTGIGITKIGRFGDRSVTPYLPTALQLAVEYVNNVEVSILQKFFINCAINPLTALHDCTNGELLRNPDLYPLFQQLCRELQTIYQAVAQDKSEQLPAITEASFDVLQQASLVAAATADNHSSMLQDYRKRRTLELQYLNRQVIVLAKRFNIACPVNVSLVSRLQTAPR